MDVCKYDPDTEQGLIIFINDMFDHYGGDTPMMDVIKDVGIKYGYIILSEYIGFNRKGL